MATTPRILTYEEWLALPEVQDGTDEIVKGELRFMPPTYYPHAEILRRINRSIDRQLDETKAIVLDSNFGLMISREPLTCRSPDLAVYWLDKLVIRDGLYWSAPGLIVEIESPSETRAGKQEKLDDYAKIGVPEVWMASYPSRSVEVYLLHSGKLERTAVVTTDDLKPTQFPGVAVPVNSIWPD